MLRVCRTTILLLLVVLYVTSGSAPAQDPNAEKYPPGLIVTSIAKGSPAEQTGLKVGDMLLSFDGKPLRFESQIGPFRDKALWDNKKTVALAIRRGAENLTLNMTLAPALGFSAQPPLPPAAQMLYDEANALPKPQAAVALAKLQAAAGAAAKAGDYRAAASLWWRVFNDAADGSKEQYQSVDAMLVSAHRADDKILGATSLEQLGNIANYRGKLDEAESRYKDAL
jgi:hypothetical protein